MMTYLDFNKLSHPSMLSMKDNKWGNLTQLWMGFFDFMKGTTELEIRDANNFRG